MVPGERERKTAFSLAKEKGMENPLCNNMRWVFDVGLSDAGEMVMVRALMVIMMMRFW